MADFALPQALSISDVRRNGMPAVRRTVIHGSTSQNSYGPGELVYIPVDTGASGSFFDVTTSRLDMTVNVYNRNLFVDFINLPRCGWNAIIEEFGIEVHNSMHDNQRFYAEMVEQEMVRNGENMVPYELTLSNPYELAGGVAGALHCNFVKPSMITTAGLPHGVRYAVLKQPAGSNVSSSVPNIIAEGLLLNGHSYLKTPYGRNGYGTIADKNLHSSDLNLKSGGFVGRSPGSIGLRDQFGWWAETSMPVCSHYDDRIHVRKLQSYLLAQDPLYAPAATTTSQQGGSYIPVEEEKVTDDGDGVSDMMSNHDARTTGPDANTATYTNRGNINTNMNTRYLRQVLNPPTGVGTTEANSTTAYDSLRFSVNRFHGMAGGGNDIRRYAFVFPRTSLFGAEDSDNTMFDVHYGQSLGGYTPFMWPAKQPTSMQPFLAKLHPCGVNTKNIHNYYANCKNIPISVPVDLTREDYGRETIWGSKIHQTPSSNDSRGEKYSFRISLKIYSCLLGVFADKWFPSLLIGAGRMRMRFRLQQPNILFQTLMDPCRVVPGTARDRFPNLGICNSNNQAISKLTSQTPDILTHGVHPIMIQNYTPGMCYNDLIALGKYAVPQMKMNMTSRPNRLHTTVQSTLGVPRYQPADRQTHEEYGGINEMMLPSEWEILSTASMDRAIGTHSFKSWIATGFNTIPGPAANHVYLARYDLLRRLESVLKVISDTVTDLEDNSQYGFQPRVMAVFGDGPDPAANVPTQPSSFYAATKTPLVYYDIENANNAATSIVKVSDVPDDVGPSASNLFTKTNYRLNPPSVSAPLFAYQNYYTATNNAAFYTDIYRDSKPDLLRTRIGSNTPRITDNDQYAIQRIFHPLQKAGEPLDDFGLNGQNWELYAPPQVQYVPVRQPWNKLSTRILSIDDFVNENTLCYGTHLAKSVAQVRRTNKNLFPLAMDSVHSPTITERVTYTVSNISYRVEEIILPESASMQIIASAMEGGITMETDTIKSVEQILPRQANQKILINVSAGIVNDICFIFQPTEMLQGDKSYGYNSFATYCPFTSFKFLEQKEGTTDLNQTDAALRTVNSPPGSANDYNYLGGEPNYYNQLVQGENIGINIFMSIATEYFPRNPIDDLQTLIDHVTWGDQRRGDIEYLGLLPLFSNAYDTGNFNVISPFQDGFFSVFTPIECLDDQTITDNPFWTPLECNVKRLLRGKRAKKNALPFYKPLDGTFHLSLNLQAFMGHHDRMNVGTPMVNNNAYLQMQNCHLLQEFECRMIVFIRVFARIIIERGGIIQIFT